MKQRLTIKTAEEAFADNKKKAFREGNMDNTTRLSPVEQAPGSDRSNASITGKTVKAKKRTKK